MAGICVSVLAADLLNGRLGRSLLYASCYDVWDGQFFRVWTAWMPHADVFHLVFNVTFLIALGRTAFIGLGWFAELGCLMGADAIAFLNCFCMSQTVPVGASGAVFGTLGFLLVRWRGRRDIQRSPLCLVLVCYVLADLAVSASTGGSLVVPVSHAMSCGFGLLYGAAGPRWLKTVLAFGTMAVAVVPAFWMPWSGKWIAAKAYADQRAGHIEESLINYKRALELRPDLDWGWRNVARIEVGHAGRPEVRKEIEEIRQLSPPRFSRAMAEIREGGGGESAR